MGGIEGNGIIFHVTRFVKDVMRLCFIFDCMVFIRQNELDEPLYIGESFAMIHIVELRKTDLIVCTCNFHWPTYHSSISVAKKIKNNMKKRIVVV